MMELKLVHCLVASFAKSTAERIVNFSRACFFVRFVSDFGDEPLMQHAIGKAKQLFEGLKN